MAVKNSKELMFFTKLKYRCFEVADYDLATRLSKFKLADPIRHTIWRSTHVTSEMHGFGANIFFSC